ncbi:MAG: ATP-grasp domain-containing protein [Anaerolineaceae bacterium]|nr:MAG: ATP-grasp domain-containing protein [Anaerolineaceae bacterium]
MRLRKCLVANRGEIALRIIRACHESGLQAVAVYSSADANAAHVQTADAAYAIGDAPAAGSYLNIAALLDVAERAGCDCVHPGYGFLAESADFADAVIDAGLIWVGPSPHTIREMGVKTRARDLMASAGVPLVPGYQSDAPDFDGFFAAADEIGFPLMVKSAGGGGGKGIRIVHDPALLGEALESARREALNAFGDGRVFLERYITEGRHIEVQIIADAHGNTCHLLERECSTQRRHQKIIEEAPSPLLDDATRDAITSAAVRAAQAVDYVNAGTVEFIATPDRQFYFLEMNTRLQVEHPVTEMITGVDIVRLQFAIADGQPLPFTQDDIRANGHAIECRLYAEDAASNFLPATGTVQTFIAPHLPGVRVDAGVRSGDAITIHYDPMIAKIIAHARTREEAIIRLRHALAQTVILGTITNRDFLLALLDDARFKAGAVHTATIDAALDQFLPTPPDSVAWEALVALAYDELMAGSKPTGDGDDSGDGFSAWDVPDGFRLGSTRTTT